MQVNKIPFLGWAYENAQKARGAIKKNRPVAAIQHGTAAVADVVLPGFIGKSLYDMHKDNKMLNEELQKIRGISKEACVVFGKIAEEAPKPAPKPGVLKGMWKHKVPILVGLGGLGAGALAMNTYHAGKHALSDPRTYGPTQQYGGQLA